MAETLLSFSAVLLYGRLLQGVSIDFQPPPESPIDDVHPPEPVQCELFPRPDQPPRYGGNKFLQHQLQAPDAALARIYAFSFEGHYYDLPKPVYFLVHGPGSDPEAWRPGNMLPEARVSRAPADADRTGVASSPSSFSEDMRVWAYDKDDLSLRLDPYSGTLEQILLERCLAGGPGAYGAAVSGAAVSGAAVSGAAVSGAGAHGAGAFGAGAFGAGAFGRGRRGGGD